MKGKKRISLLAVLVCLLALVLSLGLMSACGNTDDNTTAGNQWYYGAEVPADTLGREGDYYLNTQTLASYVKTENGTWTETAANWYYGTEEPVANLGATNDFYLNTNTGALYQKKADGWGSPILTLKGEQGKPGRDGVLWFSGDKDPEASDPLLKDAIKGDFYLNTDDFTVWQLTDTEWSNLGSIASRGVENVESSGNKLKVTFTDGTVREFTVATCFGEHDFGDAEPTTIIEVGCTERGLILKTCTVCGTSIVESVEPTGHQFVDGVCSVCGKNQLEGHYEVNGEGNCEVTISPDLVEEGEDLTITSSLNDADVEVKGAISDEVVSQNGYQLRSWLRDLLYNRSPIKDLHIGTLVIEDGVNVGAGAFAGATIEHLVLEGNASYGAYAFDSVKGLQDVTIKGTTTLGAAIFDADATLQSVDMSEATIAELPSNTFSYCSNLTEVKLPSAGLETIGINVFLDCTSLQEIVLPEGVKTIKECAFSGADIREIVFPKTLTEIQIYVFQNNKNLTKAVFQAKIEPATFGNDNAKKQIHADTIFRGCYGSDDVPLQICFTGSKADWEEEEFSKVIYSSNGQQVVYDYKLT